MNAVNFRNTQKILLNFLEVLKYVIIFWILRVRIKIISWYSRNGPCDCFILRSIHLITFGSLVRQSMDTETNELTLEMYEKIQKGRHLNFTHY